AVLVRAFDAPWIDADVQFPLWSYFTFTQNVFMAATNSIGAHWLSPTWTLAIEEHFYLIVPALFFLVPRRYIAAVLIGGALGTVVLRAVIYYVANDASLAALALLPTRADVLILAFLAALALKTAAVPCQKIDGPMRLAPILLLATIAALKLMDADAGHSFAIFGPLLAAIACAAFLLSLVRGAPEAKRFHSRVLCFFGTTSYAVYLVHLPIL